MKKFLAIIVSFALFVAMAAAPASADMIIGEMETDFPIYGLSDFTVRTIVSRYFTQRKAYLQGTSETISAAVSAMVTDEAAHKEALTEANAVLTNSTITINSVIIGDYVACVDVAEAATFLIDDEVTQETVAHTIRVYTKSDDSLIVGSDGYIVNAVDFTSAAYVSPEALALINITPYGSTECIVRIAIDEVGTTPNSDGTTKYGIWYEQVCDTGPNDYMKDFSNASWCAMFVTWCAYHANVPDTMIPYTAWAPDMSDYLDSMDSYHRSASGNGNYTPQPGDLIFIGVNDSDTFASPGHVGIVAFVTANAVHYVEGNYTYWTEETGTSNQVWFTTKSLTDTDILGYGNPDYRADSHIYQEWGYDNYMHWSTCAPCGFETMDMHNLQEIDVGHICTVCGYIEYY